MEIPCQKECQAGGAGGVPCEEHSYRRAGYIMTSNGCWPRKLTRRGRGRGYATGDNGVHSILTVTEGSYERLEAGAGSERGRTKG